MDARTTSAGVPMCRTGSTAGACPADNGLDVAWRIHNVLSEGINRVDGKAAFALSLASAALAAVTGVAALHGTGQADTSAAVATVVWCSGLLILAALALAVAAVIPRSDRRGPASDRQRDLVYFGHLRHWDAEDLAEALAHRDLLPVVSRQLVTLARIAWVKHRLVRASLLLASIGVALAALPTMMNVVA